MQTEALNAAGVAMWRLVERYTGRVGYRFGAKTAALEETPAVIDCSGWVKVLLTEAMNAVNAVSDGEVFSASDISGLRTWSDRMVEVLERRSGGILEGDEITARSLPPYATIGLQKGGGAWATNHSRPRGITHVVQVLRRPSDGSRYVSESQGMIEPRGIRLTPLADWLRETADHLRSGKAWAVNAFNRDAVT